MDQADGEDSVFRVAYVPGVTLSKWSRVWGERMPSVALDAMMVSEADQLTDLRGADVDVAFVRLPVSRDGIHLIPLYRERPVVIVPREHPVTLFDEVTSADLADETMLVDTDAWESVAHDTGMALELVVAGIGVHVAPMSVARLHHRRDLEHRVVTDLPETEIGLAWRIENESPLVEEWVGVVRGRTANSSRGSAQPGSETRGSPERPSPRNAGKHAKPSGKRPRPNRIRRSR